MTTRLAKTRTIWLGICAIAALLFTAACASQTAAAPTELSSVEVVPVEQRDVPIYHEWIGTLNGLVNADIKAQVAGYLLSQNYSEGSFVKQGDLLFQIDPRPFQAAVDQAQGQLAQANGQLAQAKAQLEQTQAQLLTAEANQHKTQLDEDRYTPLARERAVTQQDMDNATQNNLAAKAQVQAAKAQVETARAQIQAAAAAVEAANAGVQTARLNLGFTRLTSPINGVAGAAQVQVGNLVGPSSTAVTTVSTLDPIKAKFTVSEQEYLTFRKDDLALQRLQLDLVLADGSTYPHKGKFSFADRQVNPETGAIELTGLFPNPGNKLRPGQYGRVRAIVGSTSGALLVPQRSVTELQGSYQVAVVDAANAVRIGTVQVGDRVGRQWIVKEGLKPGDRVIAEGVLKVRPGQQVSPRPYVAPPDDGGSN
ncbi:MAG TPA: efflux RND transporter periplasmic adaptor subunit [Candidatus Sulfopaludibacter sp.]|jgi:membrane fusion protein (multidrug efflux system)|nr:efflux RND transporter periplasmic adaptor subunit [Candidatus Sulfopaludibacter sp.]